MNAFGKNGRTWRLAAPWLSADGTKDCPPMRKYAPFLMEVYNHGAASRHAPPFS
jgi:hypothetical protein